MIVTSLRKRAGSACIRIRSSLFHTVWLAALAGCTTLPNDIQSSIELASQCRQLEDNKAAVLALTPKQFAEQLRTRVLAKTYCLGPDNKLAELPLMQCAVADLERRAKASYPEATRQESMAAIQTAQASIKSISSRIESGLDTLLNASSRHSCREDAGSVRGMSACHVRLITKVESASVTLASLIADLNLLGEEVLKLQMALAQVRGDATAAQKALAAETLRFAQSADAFLRQATAAVLGDVNGATADALLSSTIYQRAYRIFDLVDQGLLPMETLLERADEKVYGAVSLSMFFFQNDIQKAVSGGIARAVQSRPEGLTYWVPLGIAACERIADSKVVRKSPTLQPLVERGLAEAVEKALKQSRKNQQAESPGTAMRLLHRTAIGSDEQVPVSFGRSSAVLAASGDRPMPVNEQDGASPPSSSQAGGEDVSGGNLKAYVLAEWAVRRALTGVGSTSPGNSSPGAAGASRPESLLVTPADDAQVRRQALSLSATQVSSGALTTSAGVNLYSTSLTSMTAQSVSTAAAVAAASASNSNSQTFVIQVPNSAPATPEVITRQPLGDDLCSRFPAGGNCLRAEGAHHFNIGGWSGGEFVSEPIRDVLTFIARTASGTGRHFRGEVVGYASSAPFACRQAREWEKTPGSEIRVRLLPAAARGQALIIDLESADKVLHAQIRCNGPDDTINGNRVLAIARAMWTAHVLSRVPATTISIDPNSIAGLGTAFAATSDKATDRKVTLQLIPTPRGADRQAATSPRHEVRP
jgi:hypothetical protein